MLFMVLVIFPKDSSMVECVDRNTIVNRLFLCTPEGLVLRGLGWTCSRAVVNQP